MPNSRSICWRYSVARRGRRARTPSVSTAARPHRLQLARRARAARRPSGRAPSARAGTTRPGRRARPARGPSRPPGSRACLRFGVADAPRGRGPASAAISGSRISRSAPPAPRRAPSRGPGSAPTTSAVRSSAVGPSPPLVTIRSTPSAREEAQRALDVLGPVADDRDVGEVDAELAQPLGQPRAVAVGDAAGEDLGAGDDDARAGAHVAGRRSSAAAAATRRALARDRRSRCPSTTSGTSRSLPLTRSATAPLPSVIRKRFER